MTSKDLIININRLPDHLIDYIYKFIKKEKKYNYKKIKFRIIIFIIIIFSIFFCYLIGYIITKVFWDTSDSLTRGLIIDNNFMASWKSWQVLQPELSKLL